jgi:hypothetical protein
MQWVRDYSAFVWLNGSTPLRNGVHPGHLALMLALTAGFVLLGTAAFQRRDIAT